jgi:hypothetical protein
MKKYLIIAVLLIGLASQAHAQANCSITNYPPSCVGVTMCVAANGSSKLILPSNLYRRYLLIQNESDTVPVYFAIGQNSISAPLVAVIGTNTFQIVSPQGNYEISALNATATPPTRVPTGAVAVTTGGTAASVCITEGNG